MKKSEPIDTSAEIKATPGKVFSFSIAYNVFRDRVLNQQKVPPLFVPKNFVKDIAIANLQMLGCVFEELEFFYRVKAPKL